MQREHSRERYEELAAKWLNGTITEEEAAEYANWYNSGQDEPLEVPADFAADRETHRLRMLGQINAGLHSAEMPKRRTGTYWKAAAAVLILLSAGAYWFSRPVKQQVGTTVQAVEDIAPGKNGAVLVLANGKEIVLDDAADGQVAQQGGVQIVKSGGALAYEANGMEGTTLVYNTIRTPRGRHFELRLPDGTRAWLNAGSAIRYPASFGDDRRSVEMEGEVYFEVAKDASRPFSVTVNGMEVAVLGTRFNIMAYANEKDIRTSLLEGAVAVSMGGARHRLAPGQEAVAGRESRNIRVMEADTEQALAWKEGYFRFNRAGIPDVMRQLERWYDIEVRYEGNIPAREFGGELSRSLPMSGVLRFLEKAGVNFRQDGNIITVLP